MARRGSEREKQVELSATEQVLDGPLPVGGDEGCSALGALLGVPGFDATQPGSRDDVELSDAEDSGGDDVSKSGVA